MRAKRIAFVCGLTLVGFMSCREVWAAPRRPKMPFDIKIETNKTTDRTSADKGSMGDANEKTEFVEYKAILRNTQFMKTFERLEIRFYVVAESYTWSSFEEQYKVKDVFTKSGINLGQNETKTIELGAAEFSRFQSHRNNVRWRGGWKEKGHVVELYQDKKLIGFEYSGGTKAKRAYETYMEEQKKQKKKGKSRR